MMKLTSCSGTIIRRLIPLLFAGIAFIASSHDLYIRMEDYHLQPGNTGVIMRYSGSINRSENIIHDYRLEKAIFQVGNALSEDFGSELGCPLEFIPPDNPCQLKQSNTIRVRLVFQGKALAGCPVYAGTDLKGVDSEPDPLWSGRTDEEGMVAIPLSTAGLWYLRCIHTTKAHEPDHGYRSHWATLTFQID